jgi:hypothetical protein
MDETNLSSHLHGNGIGMASSHYGVVYHVCRHVSAPSDIYVTYRFQDKLMRRITHCAVFPLSALLLRHSRWTFTTNVHNNLNT